LLAGLSRRGLGKVGALAGVETRPEKSILAFVPSGWQPSESLRSPEPAQQCKRPLVQGVASGLSIPCFISLGPAVVPATRARMGISQKRMVKAVCCGSKERRHGGVDKYPSWAQQT